MRCGARRIYIISKHSDIEFASANISNGRSPYIDKRSIFVTENKNQLREESIDFAIMVSDICDGITGGFCICESTSALLVIHWRKYS